MEVQRNVIYDVNILMKIQCESSIPSKDRLNRRDGYPRNCSIPEPMIIRHNFATYKYIV